MKPTNDKVVLRLLPSEEVTAGGIFVVPASRERPNKGEIIEVGPGKWVDGVRQPMSVKVGDKVIFGRFNGMEFELNGERVVIMNESDIQAVVE